MAEEMQATAELESQEQSWPLAAIGGSAGSLEPYMEIVGHLPADTGMSFVILPHLPAGRETHLAEALSRRTAMPVTAIEEGIEPRPNTIYVLPPGSLATISEGLFHLEVPSS